MGSQRVILVVAFGFWPQKLGGEELTIDTLSFCERRLSGVGILKGDTKTLPAVV